jgi:hypothetical protein
LSVVEGEFRPEIGGNMVLQGQAADDRDADRMGNYIFDSPAFLC